MKYAKCEIIKAACCFLGMQEAEADGIGYEKVVEVQ